MDTFFSADPMIPADRSWQEAKNILCIRLDSLGDVLMTTPALRAIKESETDRKITLLTSSAGAEIASLIPEVDEVISYDAPWVKSTQPRPTRGLEQQMINQLSWKGFDAAIIFTVFSQNPLPAAFLAYLADIPLCLAHCRENPYQLLTHWVRESDDFQQPNIRHEVRRQLDLVATVGFRTTDECLSLKIPLNVLEKIKTILQMIRFDTSLPWAILHPGATAASRRYPAEQYTRVAQMLVEDQGIQVLFTGTKTETELVEKIRNSMSVPSASLVGILNIAEFSGLISLAPALISNNTGPVHIAAAVGTPVVDLYALTNPQHTPWMVPNRVLFQDVPCKFCYKSLCPEGHHNCLTMVPPEHVVQACIELLEEGKGIELAIEKKETNLCLPLE